MCLSLEILVKSKTLSNAHEINNSVPHFHSSVIIFDTLSTVRILEKRKRKKKYEESGNVEILCNASHPHTLFLASLEAASPTQVLKPRRSH